MWNTKRDRGCSRYSKSLISACIEQETADQVGVSVRRSGRVPIWKCSFLCSCIISAILSVSVVPAFGVNASVAVTPAVIAAFKGDVFSANVTLTNVSNLIGWEFRLYWNRTVLNCTFAELHVPDVWSGSYLEVGNGLENFYNTTHGRYWKAVAGAYPAPAFSGSMALVTFTFKALRVGATVLDLRNVILVDAEGLPTAHVDSDGSVTVQPPPLYMRSDQHTVNNATMYKLMQTHTGSYNVTSMSRLDPENEFVCYWSIRVWKRMSNGTETELTPCSPVAVVSRQYSGSGLQSASWNCPQTPIAMTDSLVVRVYYRFDYSNYTMSSQFSTVQLNATFIFGQTWTFYYYTQRSYSSPTHSTTMSFFWDNNYPSRIENVDYALLSPP